MCVINTNIYATELKVYAKFHPSQSLGASTNTNLAIQLNEVAVTDSSQFTMDAVMTQALPSIDIAPAEPLAPDSTNQYSLTIAQDDITVEDGLFLIVGHFIDQSGVVGNQSAPMWFPLWFDSQAPELIKPLDTPNFFNLTVEEAISPSGLTSFSVNARHLTELLTMEQDYHSYTFENASDIIVSDTFPLLFTNPTEPQPGPHLSINQEGSFRGPSHSPYPSILTKDPDLHFFRYRLCGNKTSESLSWITMSQHQR